MKQAVFGHRNRRSPRLIRLAVVGLLAILLTILPNSAWVSTAQAQFAFPSPAVEQDPARPPAGVQRFGAIEVAPVTFVSKELFKVVALTVRNRNNWGNLTPVEVRAEQVEANLNRIIATDLPPDIQEQRQYSTNFDPKTLQVFPSQLNGATVIVAKDDYRTQLLDIVTVTQLDADYYGLTIEELAARWQTILYENLRNELVSRQPERYEIRVQNLVKVALATIVLSLLLYLIQKFLLGRQNRLKQRITEATAAKQAASPALTSPPSSTTGSPVPVGDSAIAATDGATSGTSPATQSEPQDLVNAVKRQFSLERRLGIVRTLRWLVNWGQLAVWVLGIAAGLYLFPETRRFGQQLLDIPISLLLIWLGVNLLDWLGDVVINRLAEAWEDDQFTALFGFEDVQRRSLRISTTVSALRSFKTFTVYGIGLAWILQKLGFPIASVLAVGGIVAFALSLGFQNLIKDLVNGCLILWEDQYGIGDVISVNGSTGLVENMNLRVTQIRDGEGRLITIPNSAIAKVENLTRTWSRVDFAIEVAYETDIDKALAVINEVAQRMYDEPEWHDRIPSPPEVLGVDQLSHSGMLIRVWIKTQPLQQWVVGREFRRRIRTALEQHHIQIGVPQQETRFEREMPLTENNDSAKLSENFTQK